jgi:hypothetical protein
MKDRTRYRFRLLGMVAILIATFGLEGAAQAPPAPNAASQKTGSDASKPANRAQSQTQPKQSSPLKIAGPTTLILDPVCNACAGAPMKLSLRYEEPAAGQVANAGKTYPLDLWVDPLKSDDKTANARVSVEGEEGKVPLPAEIKFGESIKFQVKVMGVLAPGNWKTKVYNGLAEVGEVTFTLPAVPMNLSVEGLDPKAPAITLTRGEEASIVLKNEDATGYPFRWDFRFGSGGETEKTDGKVPGSSSTILKIKPKEEWFREGTNEACSWRTAWVEFFHIPCNWRAIFKDKEADGLLEVRLASRPCADDAGAPVKLIHVKTTLAYYGPNRKAFWSYAVTLFLLFAGAVLSLYVNYKLPDDQIRSELRQQWKEIGKGIGDLSMKLASRLRVLVGMEWRLLEDRLKKLAWYTPEFEAQRSQIADSIARLKRRVDILKKMSRAREEYVDLEALEVPPLIMSKLEEGFEQLGRKLDDFQVSDADLMDAEAKLNEMCKLLSGWKQADAATSAEIVASLRSLYDDLQQPQSAAPLIGPDGKPVNSSADPTAPKDEGGALYRSESLKKMLEEHKKPDDANSGLKYKAVASLVADLKMPPPEAATLAGTEYYRKAVLAFRGEVLSKYAILCDTKGSEEQLRLVSKRENLFKLLSQEGWHALRRAKLLVSEMSCGIYSEDIKREILEKRVEIRLDRNVVRAFEPALLNVQFKIPRFETCSARNEWLCKWDFGHMPFERDGRVQDGKTGKGEASPPGAPTPKDAKAPGGPELKNEPKPDEGKKEEPKPSPGQKQNGKQDNLAEEGWSVAHYFPEPRDYTLTVRFRDEEGVDLDDPNVIPTKTLTVGAPSEQTKGKWRKRIDYNAALRLVLALIPAVVGMVGGVKDEFLKMDLFLALGSIFGVGFASDTVKNLLTQKSTKT